MPTVSVGKELIFDAIGQRFSDEEFGQLCFDFGVELDEVTSEKEMVEKEKGDEAAKGLSEEVLYKIDVPANRYDILCLEGIARAFRIYLEKEPTTVYDVVQPAKKITMTVQPQTDPIRPFVVCAVLRNITFTEERYKSFIDLQDKLHQNIGRRRTLIAIGTHDLDTLHPPFTYEACPQKDIRFKALTEEKEMAVDELFHYYKNKKENCHLKEFLHITENSPVHPVIYDSKRTVLSLPPIINGEHSKIKLETKNVFIECTGVDMTKLNIVLNMMISMFSQYCAKPFNVESCDVLYPDGRKESFPQMEDKVFTASPEYINRLIGIEMDPKKMPGLLRRMQLPTEYDESSKQLVVRAPVTRADILHPCDIMEDVAIAYGYNNIQRTLPKCNTVGRQLPINKLSDLVREVVAQSGFVEVMTWVLSNAKENFEQLRQKDDGSSVTLANWKTEEFTICRTTLIPGVLKCLCSNKGRKGVNLPVRVFESGDVVLRDESTEVGARNSRRIAALYCGMASGFEEIHALLDRIMLQLEVDFKHDSPSGKRPVYELRSSDNETFFPKRRADVVVDGKKVGVFGILHPDVLKMFEIPFPCSVLELDIEPFL